nr:CheR family methyltransferase [Candidatus Cloacimonadota bacterium]
AKGYVKVKNEIRQMVQFKRINLIEAFPDVKQFDIIFCRNVMIYFDLPTKQMIVNKLAEHIKPGGYLFIGHSESLNGLKSTLKYVMPATYRKEGF